MSKLSLYETKWTDLVFENKNKEYGAYQLRQENAKTTVTALFMGLLLITAVSSIPVLINQFRTEPIESEPTIIDKPITPVIIDQLVIPTPPAPVTPPAQQSKTTVTDAHQLVNPVVTKTANAVQDIAPNTDNVPAVDNANTGDGPATTNPIPGGSAGNGDIIAPPTNVPYTPAVLDKMPEFPGGIQNFYNYVGKNFHRPELDEEKTLRVYVSFIVERDGSLTDIVVKNDPGYGMGKEAIRVLKSLKTKWSPGMLDGKAVRTAYNLPITIKTEVE
ncbi:energy transducer TonB [Flavobacterium hungaricum]|uniref:Energy transducer TonB n=1 Tax=Flavobacterium hungaricum TaxID=2082725 RepID=A0ABR9TR78_9FLAO|nr:energy transducer TonB [Flavobacterium hungaricum]MBE8727873.1 energy transducer TonB [Flavobacterium hungaricum]